MERETILSWLQQALNHRSGSEVPAKLSLDKATASPSQIDRVLVPHRQKGRGIQASAVLGSAGLVRY